MVLRRNAYVAWSALVAAALSLDRQGASLPDLRRQAKILKREIQEQERQCEKLRKQVEGGADRLRSEFEQHAHSKKKWIKDLKDKVAKLNQMFDMLMRQLGNRGSWTVGGLVC